MEISNERKEELLKERAELKEINKTHYEKIKEWQELLIEMITKELKEIMDKYEIYYIKFQHHDLPDLIIGDYDDPNKDKISLNDY